MHGLGLLPLSFPHALSSATLPSELLLSTRRSPTLSPLRAVPAVRNAPPSASHVTSFLAPSDFPQMSSSQCPTRTLPTTTFYTAQLFPFLQNTYCLLIYYITNLFITSIAY